jgi:hypothetical protein
VLEDAPHAHCIHKIQSVSLSQLPTECLVAAAAAESESDTAQVAYYKHTLLTWFLRWLQVSSPQTVLPLQCFNLRKLLQQQDETNVADWSGICKAAAAAANPKCAAITKQRPLYNCTYQSLSSFYQIQQHIRTFGAVVTRYASLLHPYALPPACKTCTVCSCAATRMLHLLTLVHMCAYAVVATN